MNVALIYTSGTGAVNSTALGTFRDGKPEAASRRRVGGRLRRRRAGGGVGRRQADIRQRADNSDSGGEETADGAGPRTQAVGFALLKTPGRRGPEIRRKGMLKGQWDEIELGNRASGGVKWGWVTS